MPNLLKAIFVDHPQTVDESYFEHFRFALMFSAYLALASMAGIVHALIPCLCQKTASNIIRRLHNRIENR